MLRFKSAQCIVVQTKKIVDFEGGDSTNDCQSYNLDTDFTNLT